MEEEDDVISVVTGTLETDLKSWKGGWKSWKLADESRPFKLQYGWDRPEYWEDSKRLKETCCQSISGEKPSPTVGVKNSQEIKKNKVESALKNKMNKILKEFKIQTEEEWN